jgi:DNA invertase Pin-like site-specific DNA recombinase
MRLGAAAVRVGRGCGDCATAAASSYSKLAVSYNFIDLDFPALYLFECGFQKWEGKMAIFGYARVSTRDQDLGSQIAELQAAGCGNIFREKASGAKTDRPELAKVIRRLEHGDVLVVTRLDRLARSTRDLLNILDAVAKAGAGFKSLKDTWADTTTPHGRLMLTVLGGLAEFERELIRARTDDGRRRAQARGVRFGRPLALTAHQRQEAIQRLSNGEAQADVARSFNVSQATISRLAAPSPFEASAAGL